MEFNQELIKLAEEIFDLETVELSDIPEIELYMDQVTTFMETKLDMYKRNDEDKILTKTMINNYAKAKLFPPPMKKKYNKNHIMLLIIIYHLKSILSISDIKTVLSPITKELTINSKSKILETVYKNFIIIQKSVKSSKMSHSFSNNHELLQSLEIDKTSKDFEVIENILTILILAVYSNTEKRLAEKIIDNRF